MSDMLTETSPEQQVPSPDEFKELIARADGTLIPLEKQTSDGKRIFIATRYATNPYLQDSPAADKYSLYWEIRKGRESEAFTAVLVTDTYIDEGGVFVPAGHMDWWLRGDYANGGGNMHEALLATAPQEESAKGHWKWDNLAFATVPQYQNEGLGSLMLASSAIALAANGAARFYTGSLLEPAKKTYAHFDIHPDDFPPMRMVGGSIDITMSSLPIERLAENPYTDKVVGEFARATA